MSTIRPQGVLRRCKLYVGYQIYTVKSKKCNFETPKKWAKWSMEALNHIFYINMGLNCPTEVVSQFSIFSPNTPLQDHCVIYEAFGCIKTVIFTENANLSKTGFKEKNHTIGSTDHQVQFFNGFAIFHTPQGTHEVWKIAKKHNPLVKFGCGTYCIKV